ncbi:MAG: ATPase domain-containing protein [Candidatus Thermoplasmatota archaeon]|nr:ATPase domain-containing protein [Candidatus Thermoplasmatota archaeon]
MKKIPSGVYGLNRLLGGGINQGSTNVVIGSAGAGKTTFATQFIRRGLEEGQEGIFVSLDENKEQIVKEAVEMGWPEILEYIDKELLVFIDASGKDFSRFIKEELPAFVEEWKRANARIVIDPLTPVMWAVQERYEQRDLLSFLFKQTRRVGTVVCTLEEHTPQGDLSGAEVVIPMYLADTVIHLRHRATEEEVFRKLKIAKCRSSKHSEMYHPYSIIKGLGVVVEKGDYNPSEEKTASLEMRRLLKDRARVLPPLVYKRILKVLDELSDNDFKTLSPTEMVDSIIEEYEK